MSLAEDNRAAAELGLSYGVYMQRKAALGIAPNVGGMRCLECGRKLSGQQRDYCSSLCRNLRKAKRRRAGTMV